MASVSGVIPNLIGGLSQQPPAARLENTAGDLRNAVPSVVSGLRKRPPFRFGADFGAAPVGGFANYLFERADNTVKVVTIKDGIITVHAEDGTSEPVTVAPGAATYLASSDPEVDFGFLTIGDTVFVYNKTKVVQDAAVTETRPDPATKYTVVVTETAAETTYTLTLTHTSGQTQVATYTKGAGAIPSADVLAESLRAAVATAAAANVSAGKPSITCTRIGNTLHFENASAWTSLALDPASLFRVYKDTIQRFTQLPVYETDGRLVKVAGDPEDTDGSYWVEYDYDKRMWSETYGPNAGRTLVASTMPHTLIDNGDGTWAFGPHTWQGREVGDADSNASPSFVGFTIQTLFLANNRMLILSDENLIASEVGTFENFYRTTCTTLVESDRLDVAALSSEDRVSKLYHAIEFDEQMLLFSDRAQFKLDNSNGLSPSTINLRLSTAFNTSVLCRPVRSGTNVLFVDDADNGAWADIREYLVDNVVGVNSSEIITKQVPEFIPTGVTLMATNPTLGTTVVLSRGQRERLFLYSAFWSDGKRLQSAWCYWDDDQYSFRHAAFVGNRLYVVVVRDGLMVLLWVNMQETVGGDFEGVEVLLDNRVTNPSMTFDGTDTLVTLPFNAFSTEVYSAVLTADGVDRAGSAYNADPSSTNVLRFRNVDLTTTPIMVGKRYKFVFELSPIFIRDDSKIPVQDGRFQVRYISLLYHLSSYFDVIVQHSGREAFVKSYTGRTLGRINNTFGDVVVGDGEFRVPVSGRNDAVTITVENDSPFNCRFSSLEWEGVWRPRTKRF